MAWAAPERYELDAARSQVAFTYVLAGNEKKGQMPVQAADLQIDLRDISASQFSVTLNARRAKAGFVIASEAMKSAKVLHAAKHPTIEFRSTRIEGTLSGARITGDLTIRGVTKSVVLSASLHRQQGTAAGDLDRLEILLTGSVNRSAFGADGYSDLVGDQINLSILARIEK